MDFTIGYINHDLSIYCRYLGKSLANLQGDFIVNSVPSNKIPAFNYNTLKSICTTPYLILTHEDVSFPPNLLECLKVTIDSLPNWGVLGLVGRDFDDNYRYSSSEVLYEVDTLDACFIVIKSDDPLFFNNTVFDDLHLYVEDYCAQHNRFLGNKNYTLLIDADGISDYPRPVDPISKIMRHHSATYSVLGPAWGHYNHYRRILESRWAGIKTT